MLWTNIYFDFARKVALREKEKKRTKGYWKEIGKTY